MDRQGWAKVGLLLFIWKIIQINNHTRISSVFCIVTTINLLFVCICIFGWRDRERARDRGGGSDSAAVMMLRLQRETGMLGMFRVILYHSFKL